jgi:ABC-2 type transport system permease protein
MWFTLVFVIPILLVANLPANVMVRTFDPAMVIYFAVVAFVMLGLSQIVFRMAMRWYRSASS